MKTSVILGTIILIMLSVGSVTAISPAIVEKNHVTVEKASEYTNLTLAEFLASGSPGLINANWSGVTIDSNSLTIYDVNGSQIFYRFVIIKEGKQVGQILASANKVLGTPIMKIELNSIPINPTKITEDAKKIVAETYPDKKIVSYRITSYSYPEIGNQFILLDPITGATQQIFIDAFSNTIVNSMKIYSLYDGIDDINANEKISLYNKATKEFDTFKEKCLEKGINPNNLSSEDIQEIQSIFSYSPLVSRKTLPVHLYPQINNDYCIPAVGQMIANYYGVSHSQSHIAAEEGTIIGIGTTLTGELHYYTESSPAGLQKINSVFGNGPTYQDCTAEINANRPFDALIGNNYYSHGRVCAGWWIDIYGYKWLYIFDPEPVNIGSISWENWYQYPARGNVYVRG
jgi:hypothetical protein